MKKIVAIAVLATTLISLMPLSAQANGAVNAALALGAFAVFNQLFLAPVWARPVYVAPSPVVYTTPVYGPPATYYAPPAIQREVVYPHGRYVLYGDGLTVAYQWVWVPNPPPPPLAPPPPR
jgi:hypothetical protein